MYADVKTLGIYSDCDTLFKEIRERGNKVSLRLRMYEHSTIMSVTEIKDRVPLKVYKMRRGGRSSRHVDKSLSARSQIRKNESVSRFQTKFKYMVSGCPICSQQGWYRRLIKGD